MFFGCGFKYYLVKGGLFCYKVSSFFGFICMQFWVVNVNEQVNWVIFFVDFFFFEVKNFSNVIEFYFGNVIVYIWDVYGCNSMDNILVYQ